MTVCGRSHRKRSRGDVRVRNSNISEELDRGIGRSDRRREVLEKGVARWKGQLEVDLEPTTVVGRTSRKADRQLGICFATRSALSLPPAPE